MRYCLFSLFWAQDSGYLCEYGIADALKVTINNSRLPCFDYPDSDIKSPEIQLNSCLLPLREKEEEKDRYASVWLIKSKGIGSVICASEKGHLDDKVQRRALQNV